MSPGLRKLALAAHLAFSVGWLGAALAYLALGIAAAWSQDTQFVLAAWIAMEFTGWFVIVPLAVAALLTGLIVSLGTPWGLFRHYWVIISLSLTLIATLVLLLHMPSVSDMADLARRSDNVNDLGGDILHPAPGLLVLLLITMLNVFKPRGMTRYGWRKQHREKPEIRDDSSRPKDSALSS